MSQQLEEAKVKLKRADRYLRFSIVLFVVFMIGATGLVSYQLYDLQRGLYSQQEQSEQQARTDRESAQERLEQALADNERLHRETQAYIKCIASALILPLASRSNEVFDQCGIQTQSSSTATTQTPAALPTGQSQPKNPTSSQPTTSSPPDPDAEAQKGGMAEGPKSSTPSLVDRLLRPITSRLRGE